MNIKNYMRALFYSIRPFENAQHFAMTAAGFVFGCYYIGICVIDLKAIFGAAAVFSFLSQVLSYNNYATFDSDLKDPSKKFEKKFSGINVSFLFYVSAFFFILTVIFSLLTGYLPAIIFILLMIFWGLYTHPVIMLKKGRFVPYILDMITMPFLCFYGSYLTGQTTLQALMFSVFFGLTEIAGHINHITMDHDTDMETGVKTLAVRMGPRFTFTLSMIFFAASAFYFLLLSIMGLFPIYIGVLFMPALLIQAAAALKMVKGGFDSRVPVKFRTLYRFLYLIASAVVAVFLISRIERFMFRI